MKKKKLILPAEVKVCATCSFWDGERSVDGELGLVVINADSAGECIVHEKPRPGLAEVRRQAPDCAWEHLAPDGVASEAGKADQS